MKQTKNFNINVPELGDLPDITQVSDAIQSLEDALAGTLEIMTASIQGNKVTLTSGSRTTKRTRYYEGMAIKFVAPIQINPNTITLVAVDDLSDQVAEIPFLVNAGDSVDIIYKGNKFVATITAIQRSNSVTSTSTTTVATSQAVKTLNDSKMSRAGDTMTGDLKIQKSSPIVEFYDTRSSKSTGYVGNGSSEGIFQVTNRATGKSLNLHSNGNLMYDGVNVFTQAVKPTLQELNAMHSAGTLASGTNLNDVKFGTNYQSGSYKIAGSGYVNMPLGEGGSVYGTLFVQSSGYTVQMLTYTTSAETYIRTTTGSANDNWGAWAKIYTSMHKPTASDLGFIPNEALGYAYGFHNGQVSFGIGKGNEFGFGIKSGGEIYFNYSVGSGYQIPTGFKFNAGPNAMAKISCGEIVSNANITAYSDIKLKKDLEIIPNALEKIGALNGYTYTRKDSGERQTGVVAQEVQKVLPEAITITKPGRLDVDQTETLGVAYGNMVGLLIEGIK
ncbi:MAG: pyocin knob domain-containing S74 family peptidase, partial [Paraclostridium sp.]